MTAVDHTTTASQPCRHEEDLPVNPFLALRVAYGMLLGEEDFRALMGNPRGKQMLHTAWLHGAGVVWGYRVRVDGTKDLRVTPGLAIDGLGRELLLDTDRCLDVEQWLDSLDTKGEPVDHQDDDDGKPEDGDYDRVVTACLVASFDSCQTAPVPALADPCDPSRKHNDCSRVVETVRLELRQGDCPAPSDPGPYHRLRVLLGLDRVGADDPAGEEGRSRAREVAAKPIDQRAPELLRAFRALAAADVADLSPAEEEGDVCPSLFPVTEDDAPVVLAKVTIRIRDAGTCTELLPVLVDPAVRRSLIATSTIQELTCGLAPAVLGAEAEQDAGGPRVVPGSVRFDDGASRLRFRVTGPLREGSLRDHPVVVTTLSDRGWVREDVHRVLYDDQRRTVTVVLDDLSRWAEVVRVIVRGTGPTPVVGANNVPLAGLVGGPPGTVHDGHDAVLTTTIHRRAAE